MKSHSSPNAASPWPHRLALWLVCATFPLIWVGGLVTTYDAGMSVPDWPNTYGYNLFLYPWSTWIGGPWDLFIEHGHRLLAAGVGLLAIALLVVTCLKEPRHWVRWLTVGGLALVLLQGLLGGARVLLDDISLARIHGWTGPLFFLWCVAVAAVTSGWWQSDATVTDGSVARLRRPAWVVLTLAIAQLLLGSHLRHLPGDWSPNAFRGMAVAHLVVAAVLLLQAVLLTFRCWWDVGLRHRPLLLRPGTAISLLVVLQLCLGVATWLVKYSWPTWLPQSVWFRSFTVQAESMTQALTVTAHVAVGSLILATALLLALRATRIACVAAVTLNLSVATCPLEALA